MSAAGLQNEPSSLGRWWCSVAIFPDPDSSSFPICFSLAPKWYKMSLAVETSLYHHALFSPPAILPSIGHEVTILKGSNLNVSCSPSGRVGEWQNWFTVSLLYESGCLFLLHKRKVLPPFRDLRRTPCQAKVTLTWAFRSTVKHRFGLGLTLLF